MRRSITCVGFERAEVLFSPFPVFRPEAPNEFLIRDPQTGWTVFCWNQGGVVGLMGDHRRVDWALSRLKP